MAVFDGEQDGRVAAHAGIKFALLRDGKKALGFFDVEPEGDGQTDERISPGLRMPLNT